MKKRMLSLLLALVMTLSLCVPALAADEFEAETVTEVVEQAPEAPVEPEAPEAEVVEEPAVEEPVEEPEIAAAIAVEEAEDVPELAYTGVDEKVKDATGWQEHAKDGTIVLDEEAAAIDFTTAIEVSSNLTLNLNGTNAKFSNGLTIDAGAALTIVDEPEDEDADTGTIEFASSQVLQVNGTLNFNEGELNGTDGEIKIGENGIANINVDVAELDVTEGAGGTLNVNADGKVGAVTVKKGTVNISGEAGAVTVGDSGAEGAVDLTVSGKAKVTNIVLNGGTVKVEGGTVGTAADTPAIDADGNQYNAMTIEISGGTVTSKKATSGATVSVKTAASDKKVTFNMTGGKVTNTEATGNVAAIEITAGNSVADTAVVKISGGGIVAKDGTGNVALKVAASPKGLDLKISGGTFVGKTNAVDLATKEGAISGGVFAPVIDATDTSTVTRPEVVQQGVVVAHGTDAAAVSPDTYGIGNKFTMIGADVAKTIKTMTKGTAEVTYGDLTLTDDDVPGGVKIKNGANNEGTVQVGDTKLGKGKDTTAAKYEAKIGDKKYDTLVNAVAAVRSSQTIDLLSDVNLTGALAIPESMRLNANGKTITASSQTITIADGKSVTIQGDAHLTGASSSFALGTGSSLTLKDTLSYFDVKNDSGATKGTLVIESDSLQTGNVSNFDGNVTVKGELTGTATVTNGTLDVTGKATGAVTLSANGKLTVGTSATVAAVTGSGESCSANITGGEVESVSMTGDATSLTVSGGKITGALSIFTTSKAASATIDDCEVDGNITIAATAASKIEIKGGTFKGTLTGISDPSKVISGGYFVNDPETYAIAGAAVLKLDGTTADHKYSYTDSTSGETKTLSKNWYIVGADGAKAITAGLSGCVVLGAGKLTVDAVPDDVCVHVDTDASNHANVLTVGDVKLEGPETTTHTYDYDHVTGDELTELNDLIDKAYAVILNGTVANKVDQALRDAYLQATTRMDVGGAATNNGVDNAITALENALAGYEDQAALAEAVVDAEKKAASGGYTEESVKALQAVIDDAKEVLADETSTDGDYLNALAELETAVKALVPKTIDKAALQDAITAAKAYKEADYTADSYKALQTAITNAETVAKNEKATEAEIKGAIDALTAAENALVKKTETPEIPAAPTGGTGWSKADANGDYYYYKNGKYVTSQWVYGKGGLCYRIGADGKMETGFVKVDGLWYFLQTTDKGGTKGQVISDADGWVYTIDGWGTIPGGYGYFINKHNGRYGECTWTKENGDYNRTTKTWSVAQPTA